VNGLLWTLAILWLLAVPGMAWLLRQLRIRQRVAFRLRDAEVSSERPEADRQQHDTFEQRGRTSLWLYRAGFRSSRALMAFLALTTTGVFAGGVLIWLILLSPIVDQMEFLLRSIPGNIGEVFLPFVWGSPWFGGVLLASSPALYVRAVRRKRVRLIEQDIPITLDLLSALAEAGLAFDAALDRILDARPPGRPLTDDMRLFQLDLLAGRARIDALRRLRERVDVPWFSIFVSAVMHAEQAGSGLASTLRVQAEDLRTRRRERALAQVMAVPVKLLLPLIVCYLPGIMIAVLGPVAFQVVQMLDQFLRQSLGQ
jgi:tight adherence protein C